MRISLILVLIALLCDIFAFVKPSWPLTNIAVLFLCVAMLIWDSGKKI